MHKTDYECLRIIKLVCALLSFTVVVRVIRGYDRKSKVVAGVAAKASATVHDGTAKAFLYSGLFDIVEMRSEWNADNHRVCESLPRHAAFAQLGATNTCTSNSLSNLTIIGSFVRRVGVVFMPSVDKFKLVKQDNGPTGLYHPATDGGAHQPTQAPAFQGSASRKRKAFKHRVDRISGKRVKYNGIMCEDISDGTEPFPVPALNSVDTCVVPHSYRRSFETCRNHTWTATCHYNCPLAIIQERMGKGNGFQL